VWSPRTAGVIQCGAGKSFTLIYPANKGPGKHYLDPNPSFAGYDVPGLEPDPKDIRRFLPGPHVAMHSMNATEAKTCNGVVV